MNAKEFFQCWHNEKEILLDYFVNPSSNTLVSRKISELNLTVDQQGRMKEIVNDILTDTFYTLLLGLDGEANIGGIQQTYKIYDEKGILISDCGEIEAEASEQFHA